MTDKKKADLRKQAEEKAACLPENIGAQSHEETRQALHELRVHQIELEMQNEELRKMQAELETARARYFDLYDLAPVGYVTISEEGLILEANLTAAILLGTARRTALLKQPLSRFILKEDQDIYYQHRKDLSETNHHARRREQQSLDISFGLRSGQADESHAWELRMVKMDGTSFWAHLEATATQNTSMNSGQAYHGEPTCRIVMIDITEQKQVEKALLHDRIFVEALFESVPGMLYVYDDQGNHIRHNKKHEEMTGYSGEELSQLNPLSWYDDKADIVRVEAAINDVFTTGYGEVEVPMRIKNGEKLFMHFTGSRLILDGKKYFVGVGIDINARKQAEEELFKQKSLLSSIIESSSEAIFAKDTDGKYRSINEAGARMLGYGVKDVIGRTDMELLHAETAREFRKTDEDVMSSGQVYEREEIGIIDGKTCIFLAHKAPWRGNSGEIIGIIGVSSDISERKWAEEEKANLEAQIQQAQKMESVGRLAGGVAHDFNNMLGVIIGHTEMALDQVEPAQPIHADLEEILTAANRSADLTRQLLAFARKQTIAPKVLDLNKTVTGMLKMLRRLIGEDIHLNWQPDANLWPVRVDPSQIDQILANLCVNARDAISDIGKMTIETGNSAFDEDYCAAYAGFVPGEYVLLAVSDNGCGMDKETLSHLFEPFYTTKVMGKGTGLGLATVYGIVRQNNGFINVYSEPEQGTTFKIYLPRHVGKTGQLRTKSTVEAASRGHETILVVEDESSILTVTTRMLEGQGYTVLAASTPGGAIRLAREQAGEIHLLMTDVVMPEMNGRDLAKNMLSLYPHLKRLFMSGYTADVIAHHGVLDEGVYFVQKPFSIKELVAKVREALDQT